MKQQSTTYLITRHDLAASLFKPIRQSNSTLMISKNLNLPRSALVDGMTLMTKAPIGRFPTKALPRTARA